MHQCQKLQFLQQPLEIGSKSEISAMDYLVKKHVYSLGNKISALLRLWPTEVAIVSSCLLGFTTADLSVMIVVLVYFVAFTFCAGNFSNSPSKKAEGFVSKILLNKV